MMNYVFVKCCLGFITNLAYLNNTPLSLVILHVIKMQFLLFTCHLFNSLSTLGFSHEFPGENVMWDDVV